ncbi:(2Fe-2S)-binding protein [Streptomyces aureoversilis]|uniref:(2Fe-2S)-binding protein n=1 Tax=Streptomyces aureoversilis TaxID=67277 RepID=A0ABW0A5Q5_9ACTN
MSDEQRQAHAAGPVGWQPIPRGGEYDEGTTFLQLPPELLAHPGAAMNGTGAWDPLAAAGSGGYTPPSADSWQQAPAAAAAGAQGQWGVPGAYGHGQGQGHGDAGAHQGGYEPVSETSEAHGGVHGAHGGAHGGGHGGGHGGVPDAAYGETYGEGVHVGGAHGGGLHDGGLHDGGLYDGGLHDGGMHDAGVHDAGLHDGGAHEGGAHEGGHHDSTLHDGTLHDGTLHDGALHSLHDGGADPHATAEWPAPGPGSTGQWSVPAAGDDPVDESGEYLVRSGAPEAPAAPQAPWSAQPVDDSWRQSLAAATPAAGTPVVGPDTGQWSVPVLPEDAADGADTADTSSEYARDGFPGTGAENSASALPGEPPAVDATSTFTVPAYVSDVTGTGDNPGGAGTAGTENEPPVAAVSSAASEEPSSAAEPEGSGTEQGQGQEQEQQPAPHLQPAQQAVHAESFAHPGPAGPHARPTLPEQFVPPQGPPQGPSDAADAVAADVEAADVVADEAPMPSAAPADGPEHEQDAPGADADPGAGIPEHAIPGPGVPAHDTLGAGDPLGSTGDPLGSTGHPLDLSDPLDPLDPLGVPHNEHPCTSYVLRVNGTDRPVTDAWIGESLLYVLRERLGLAGAKDGCSQGECGACSVQVDGRLVASCLVPAATAAGAEVRTVEGLAVDGRPSDVQRALAECGAVQCGFCVPGMAMTMHDLLEGNHAPTERETRQAICGNLCRCSGYRGVLDAVRQVVGEREAAAAQELQDAEAQQHEVQPDADQARIPHQAGPHGGGSGKATTA